MSKVEPIECPFDRKTHICRIDELIGYYGKYIAESTCRSLLPRSRPITSLWSLATTIKLLSWQRHRWMHRYSWSDPRRRRTRRGKNDRNLPWSSRRPSTSHWRSRRTTSRHIKMSQTSSKLWSQLPSPNLKPLWNEIPTSFSEVESQQVQARWEARSKDQSQCSPQNKGLQEADLTGKRCWKQDWPSVGQGNRGHHLRDGWWRRRLRLRPRSDELRPWCYSTVRWVRDIVMPWCYFCLTKVSSFTLFLFFILFDFDIGFASFDLVLISTFMSRLGKCQACWSLIADALLLPATPF